MKANSPTGFFVSAKFPGIFFFEKVKKWGEKTLVGGCKGF